MGRWLPEELTTRILDYIQHDEQPPKTLGWPAQGPGSDELIARLWALQRVLKALDFPDDRSTEALTQLLQDSQLYEQANQEEAQYGLWGLGACIEWLALSSKVVELPSLDMEQTVTKARDTLTTGTAPSRISGGRFIGF